MNTRRILCRFSVAAALLLIIPAASMPAFAGIAEMGKSIPYALAVRGGVSLGSYEAGINWALIRYMKERRAEASGRGENHAELFAASGASAGSINAVISALSWCVDSRKGRESGLFPDELGSNLFRDTWLNIGSDDLLPATAESGKGYRPDDGVLTRNAFGPAIEKIRKALSSDIFRPDCELWVGILVTRVKPVTMSVAGVRVENQRFMIPVRLRAGQDGRPKLSMCSMQGEDPRLGNVLYLQGGRSDDADCPISLDSSAVIDALEASSAFPVAFGRKELRYCEETAGQDQSLTGDSAVCPDGFSPASAEFIDGGLFDNIPLGAARALAEPSGADPRERALWEAAGRRFNYIYLDPTVRRSKGVRAASGPAASPAATGETGGVKKTYGIRSQLGFLGGAIETGRDYELYNVLRGGDWTNQVAGYADKLFRAVKARYPHVNWTNSGPLDPKELAVLCEGVFTLDRRRPGPTVDEVSSSCRCVSSGVQTLEYFHNGLKAGDRTLRSAEEITKLRESVIAWIERIARAIGDDQLAVSVAKAKQDKLGDRRILLSRRFSPVTGEMLGFFGAFLDRSFREYDYYAGIYDAAWGIADFFCERQGMSGKCMPGEIRRVYGVLNIEKDPAANTVFLYLLRRDFSEAERRGEEWSWAASALEREAISRHGIMFVIAESLFSASHGEDGPPQGAPEVRTFISSLRNGGEEIKKEAGPFLSRALESRGGDELTWYNPLTMRLSQRLLQLEKEERKMNKGGGIVSAGMAAGALVLHSYVREEEITLNKSTAPDLTWHAWLPYEIAVDGRNGGLDISWEPSYRLGTRGWMLDLKLTPVEFNRYGGDEIWFSHADLFLSIHKNGFFSSVGLGPTWSWTWEGWPGASRVNIGASMYIGFLQDKLRLTIGVMGFREDSFPGDIAYINIGITDIPGFAYWISEAL